MRVVRVLAWLGAAIAVAVCVLALVVRTPSGLRRLAGWVERVAAHENGFRLELRGFSGHLPSEIRASQVVLADPEGPWLVAEEVRVDVAPMWLLAGRIQAERVEVERVRLLRAPRLVELEKKPPRNRLLPLLFVDSLQLGEVRIPEQWLGEYLAGPFVVTGGGRLALGSLSVQAAFDVRAEPVPGLFPPEAPVSAEAVLLRVGLGGNVRTPRVALHAELNRVAADRLNAAGLLGDLELDPVAIGTYAGAKVRMRSVFETPRIHASLDPLLGEHASIDVQGVVGPDDSRLRIESVHAAADRVEATAVGWVRLPEADREPDGELTITAATTGLRELGLEWLAGTEPVAAQVDATLDGASGRVLLSSIWLRAAIGELRGTLGAARDGSSLAGDLAVTLPAIEALPQATALGAAGAARGNLMLSGSLAIPTISAALSMPTVTVRAAEVRDLACRAEIHDVRKEPNGRIELSGRIPAGPAQALADIRVEQSTIRVAGLAITGPDLSVRGDVAFARTDRLLTGGLRGEARSLASLAPWLGGNAGGNVVVRVTAAAPQGRQALDATVEATNLRLSNPPGGRPVTASSLNANVSLPDLSGDRGGVVSLEARDVEVGTRGLSSVTLKATGRNARWSGNLSIAGGSQLPVDFSAALAAVHTPGQWHLTVAEADGRALEEEFALSRAALVRLGGGEVSVESVDLRIGGGSIKGALARKAGYLTADIALADIPASMAGFVDPGLRMNGTVGGTVSARIEDKRPQVRLALRAEALRPAGQTESPEMPRFSAVLEGIVEADDSHLRLSLHDENATALTVDARGSLLGAGPEQGGPSSDDRRPRVATAPLEISATGTVELGALDALVDLGEGRVTGRLTSDLVVRLRQPQVEIRGGLELQNGTLENPALGLLLKEGSVRLLASGRRVEISELSASDGAGGTLRGSGHADLGGEAAQTRYRLGATLAGLWVARSDDVRVQTDGDLQLEGDASGARLSGTLKTRSVELRPPRRLPPSVVQLEVIEINGPLTSPGPRTTPHAQSFPVELDVTATIPGRAFFRTVDLESEWEGDLHLTGTPQAPVLAGRLSVVRGSFNALGVPFNLVRGLLRFDERDEVDPDVEILAEARRHDIVAQLSVTGTASAPNVTLSSEPPLPTDEIASHLLFGRDATDLSAAQSVQLAAAVARFTSSTAPDPLGWVRRTLRVDRVSVQSDEERPESTVVSVGKYVGRKVFVSFDQGTTAEATSKARVEVELTRQLNVATEVGTDSESRLGLDWRYRY